MKEPLISLQTDVLGMSLRDYFAASYVQGELAAQTEAVQYTPASFSDLAKWSYQLADAMLEARKK